MIKKLGEFKALLWFIFGKPTLGGFDEATQLNIEEFVKKYASIVTEQGVATQHPGLIADANTKVACTSGADEKATLDNIVAQVSTFTTELNTLEENMTTAHGTVLHEVVRVPVCIKQGHQFTQAHRPGFVFKATYGSGQKT